MCESTALSCTGGACSRGYKRGERGREAPKSLLEEELIEASANIGVQRSVCALLVVRNVFFPFFSTERWADPPFIDTRRDGVHVQRIIEVIVFSQNRGGAVIEYCGKYTVGYGAGRGSRPGHRP